ncbi:MAG: ABC transporter permease [Ruminococcus flavefaciens]|nr:ABC transporter permease [Ruminococcus flavefaciens]
MPDDNNYTPVLEDIEYMATAQKKGAPTGVEAISLDSMETNYNPALDHKKGAPTGVEAISLDNMDSNYNPVSDHRRGDPTGVSAPVLDDMGSLGESAQAISREPEKPIITDEEIIATFNPELKAIFDNLSDLQRQQVLDMRREQMGGVAPKMEVTAPVLDEESYTPPPAEEKKTAPPPEPVEAPVLDEEPELPKYVPKYVDEDVERAKREGARQAVSSQLSSNQKDSKESLRMMLELKEQRNAELAEKGFIITIVIAVIGVVGAVAFYLLYGGKLGLDYKSSLSGIGNIIKNSAFYISLATAVGSLTLITGMGGFKSLASFIFVVVGIIQIFPGLAMIPQHNGSLALAGILYAVAIGCTIAVIVLLSASEAVGLYFKRKK